MRVVQPYPDAVGKILRSVGLSADSPELQPTLSAEELFDEDWVA